MKDYMIDASVRLVCNYADLPFKADIDESLAHRVTERVSVALERTNDAYAYLLPSGLEDVKRRSLTEKRLLHPDTASAPYSVLYLRMDGNVSVQTALYDHAAVCAYSKDGDLKSALQLARHIRHQLSSAGVLAKDPDYGYLTAHPCDAGTGMRASVLLHLPVLQLLKQLPVALRTALSHGAILRPATNDMSVEKGGMYLLENRAALGKNAEEMADDLLKNAERIIDFEKGLRLKGSESKDGLAFDAAWRAYGLARYARRMTQKDVLNTWSHLTMGVSIGAFALSEATLEGMWSVACGTITQNPDDKQTDPDVFRAQQVRQLINGGI